MATSNRIEAGLRFIVDSAQALSEMRKIREEQRKLNDEAGRPASSGSANRGAGAEDRAAAAEKVTAAKQVSAAEREAAQARRQADREALAAQRELAAEKRKAAREQAADAERQAAADRKRERDRINAEKAADKARRVETAKAAQLAPQVTDIVTGLAGGQNPLLVAIQQGGQLRDIYGGLGNAGRALMAILTPLRVLILGVGAAMATLTAAVYQGRSEQTDFNKALSVTGNTAATTFGQVGVLARQIADDQGEAIGAVRETLSILATSGQYADTTLASAGRAVTLFARATGQSTDEVIKGFADMKGGVAAWAAKTNEAYNFITAAEYRRIRDLEAQGRSNEAVRVTLDALASTMEQRVVPNLGTLERMWMGVGRALSSVWDQLKNIGRDDTAEEKIAKLTRKAEELDNLLKSTANVGSIRTRARTEKTEVDEQLADMRRQAAADALRRQEAAAAAKAQQDEIKQSQKAYQDALAGISAAGAARRLADQQAALDKEAASVKRRHAAGLTSELAYNLALNAIEQKRLQAQAANIQAQIGIEQSRVEEKPEDGLAKSARVQQLGAQLAQVNGQIAAAGVAAREIIEADALASARESAQAWARIWERANDQVRQLAQANAQEGAQLIADPAARAEAESAAQLADLKRQLAELQRDLQLQLSLTVDPGQAAALRQQLAQLAAEGQQQIESRSRRGRFASLQQQFAELANAQQQAEAAVDLAVNQGAMTTEKAEQAKFAAREKALPQLREILALMKALALTPSDVAAVEAAGQQVTVVQDRTTELGRTAQEAFRNGFGPMFASIVDGSQSAGDAVQGFVRGIAQSMLNLISQRLGEQLLDSLLPKGGGAGGGGGGGFLSAAFDFIASMFHSGGVVGGAVGMTRAVSPLVFAGAERYHTGGIAGLAPDEVPAILRQGEEVLTADDPRHRGNGGRAGGTVSLGGVNIGINIEGAQGGDARMEEASRSLTSTILSVVERWAEEQSRPGGILYNS